MTTGKHTYLVDDIDLGNVDIGRYSQIATGVSVFVRNNHPSIDDHNLVANFPFCEMFQIDYPPCNTKKEKVTIGNDVWIGTNATIFSGVTIGDGAIIGAFSVVAKDVPPFAIVVGNPAKVVRYRFDKRTRDKLLKIKWWKWSKEKVLANIDDMLDVGEFIKE